MNRPFGRRPSDIEGAEDAPADTTAPAAAPVLHGGRPSKRFRDFVLSRLDPIVAATSSAADLARIIEELVRDSANKHSVLLNEEEQRAVALDLFNDIAGLGPLEPLLQDDAVTDILVNGANQVFVERQGRLEATDVRFQSDDHVLHIAHRIAASIGRHVDIASPMLDARLADGSRVNVIIPPLSIDGPCISIRKFSRRFLGLDEMVNFGSLSPNLAKFLQIVTRCRLNVIISGGTGSGKTSLLGAMSRFIDPAERIVTIEDSAELRLQKPHVIRLETRPPSIDGEGHVAQRDLVRNALRMRPDRIIVGEVRGEEAYDMLQAMNTGHDGSMSTVHANSPRAALSRIQNMVLTATANLPSRAIVEQMASAFHLVVQIERMRDGTRRVTEVSEIAGMEEGTILMVALFSYAYRGENPDGSLDGNFLSNRIRPRFMPRIEYYGLTDALAEAMEL